MNKLNSSTLWITGCDKDAARVYSCEVQCEKKDVAISYPGGSDEPKSTMVCS